MAPTDRAEAQMVLGQQGSGMVSAAQEAYLGGMKYPTPERGSQPDTAFYLPQVDIVAFNQDAEDNRGGLWNGIKHLCGFHTTVQDEIKEHVESQMSPDDHKELQKEESDYNAKMRQYELSGSLVSKPPDVSDYPMMVQRDRMVQAQEAQIAQQVESQMTPAEQQRLGDQFNQYQDAVKRAMSSPDMLAMPEPGNAVKDYYDKIAEAADKVCHGKS